MNIFEFFPLPGDSQCSVTYSGAEKILQSHTKLFSLLGSLSRYRNANSKDLHRSQIEPSLAILCACLMTLRPLFVDLNLIRSKLSNRFLSRSKSSSLPTPTCPPQESPHSAVKSKTPLHRLASEDLPIPTSPSSLSSSSSSSTPPPSTISV